MGLNYLFKQSFLSRYWIAWLLLSLIPYSYGDTLSSYTSCRLAIGRTEGPLLVAIRQGLIAGDTVFLAVDPQTLSTQLVKKPGFVIRELPAARFDSLFGHTVYGVLLNEARRHDFPLQDAGITHGSNLQRGIDLTVDLCPSRKPLDRTFFNRLIDAFDREERPVPVSISITGVWMKEHPDDFAWLGGRVADGDLVITWINHSYSHHFEKSRPLRGNFLLEKGTDLDSEILLTEKALIDRGRIPSIFFRFPGLISDRDIYLRVISYGLIPIGSDAWLAKNQQPHNGSIVLVHANGNEPFGLAKFFNLVKKKSSIIAEKEWFLYDLRESLELKETAGERAK